MTLGIAASGPGAGRAVLATMTAAELLGRGEIGGFAVLAALTADGRLLRAETQRGGTCGLLRDNPPAAVAAIRAAERVAVITSGPDRPTPLTRFLPGAPGVGLVTGHRLPDTPGADGEPLNRAVLVRLAAGLEPAAAVAAVTASAPEADAGFIALAADGRLALADTARVARRPDAGRFEAAGDGWAVGLLHNSIAGPPDFARSVGGFAAAFLSGGRAAVRLLALAAPVPIRAAGQDRVHIDGEDRILAIETANPALPSARRRGGAIYLGSAVLREGRVVGHTASEIVVDMADGAVRAVAADQPPFVVAEMVDD
ncbi:hypothetical protein QNA08_18540 [Chelatococcus sp. SYSU_G07232]|uniref:Uncharacterized protein n=1 Tax=Chelatococcus albus TaxID=3047466 RepID=A0ABT7ALG0_9HYPH|nr:hypothetical protein [Chelatococcus sp. SYSU_G07232]MDJ1160215.1 hypothetical protein [Chelatococcus sp. SYSU_G07232]